MEQADWANLIAAETASQLVLGGVFCAIHAAAKKHVEWLGFGIGCWGLAIGAWSLSTFASRGGTTKFAAMTFTAGTTVAVALIVFGLAWMTRRAVLRKLGWVAAVSGALWQLVLGYFNPFGDVARLSTAPFPGAATLGTPTGLVLGWLFLLYLAALSLIAAAVFARSDRLPRSQHRLVLAGVTVLGLGFAVDGLGGVWMPSLPRVFPHASFAFTLLLATALVDRYRSAFGATQIADHQLSQLKQDLAAANTTLERVQGELGAKKQLAAVGELAAAIAHEVRNPLAIIMNAAAGLRRPTLGSEDRTTLLSILDEEAARLNRLVTDLLRFARPVIIKRSSVSIVELARRAEGRLEDKHQLKISVPDHPRLKVVQADANLLRLVFDNLVSNAFQAMPDGGIVQIVVAEAIVEDVPYVRIDIVDEGQGMDEQVLARATDPFYTTRPSGTGLGLPIVQRIVEAHGGRIDIESSIGRGTRVSLYVPSIAPVGELEVSREGARD